MLIDTSVLAAYAFARDKNHARAARLIDAIADDAAIVVAPVLTELFYFVTSRLSYSRAIEVLIITHEAFRIVSLEPEDRLRMTAIMKTYADNRFDYTDVAIMTVAERLNITQIATLDRRDFTIFRPSHCDYFKLLPEQLTP
jgi:hypothetical protein